MAIGDVERRHNRVMGFLISLAILTYYCVLIWTAVIEGSGMSLDAALYNTWMRICYRTAERFGRWGIDAELKYRKEITGA